MNMRRVYWAWVWTVLCVPGTRVLADETEQGPPAAVVQNRLVRFDVQDAKAGDQDRVGGSFAFFAEGDSDVTDVELELTLLGDLETSRQKQAESEVQGKYWIGLIAMPPSDALRTQLDLPADLGLLVEDVQEGAPARKSGIQPHDLLLSATIAGKPEARRLTSVADLVNAVQAAETGVLKLEFLRRGRKQSLDVVPEERSRTATLSRRSTNTVGALISTSPAFGLRWAGPMILNVAPAPLPEGMTMEFHPAEGPPEKVTVKQGDRTWDAEIKALDKLPAEIGALVQQQLASRSAVNARTAIAYRNTTARSPMLVVQGVAAVLPDDVTLTTVRTGTQPAKITMKRADQTWVVTEKDLTNLPAELRPHAEMALTGRMSTMPAPFTRAISMPMPPLVSHPYVVHKNAASRPIPATSVRSVESSTKHQQEIERQLKELAEQLEKLRQAVEKSPSKP